jgi:3'-5' exoribonuclease
MGRRYIRQFTDGDTLDEVFLVTDKQMRANRQGNPYLQIEMRDRSGSIVGRLWNATEKLFQSFDAGEFVQCKGKVQLYQGALQVILSQVSRVPFESLNPAEFLPQAEQDVAKLLEALRGKLRGLRNHHLKALAEVFLMDEHFLDTFSRAPAGVRQHHAYLGGLLEHVVNLLETAERVLPLYPDVDRDLVLMGLFLHDVGKVRELTYDTAFAYTDEGQLLGHLVIGVEMLSEKLKIVSELTGEPFPRELALRLKHIIVSHHGTLEFGSPKLPMTPEAQFVHYLDNLDAKTHMFVRELKEDVSGAAWTAFNPSLQRKLFRGGNGAVEAADE